MRHQDGWLVHTHWHLYICFSWLLFCDDINVINGWIWLFVEWFLYGRSLADSKCILQRIKCLLRVRHNVVWPLTSLLQGMVSNLTATTPRNETHFNTAVKNAMGYTIRNYDSSGERYGHLVHLDFNFHCWIFPEGECLEIDKGICFASGCCGL